jgi:hypothetical protein
MVFGLSIGEGKNKTLCREYFVESTSMILPRALWERTFQVEDLGSITLHIRRRKSVYGPCWF